MVLVLGGGVGPTRDRQTHHLAFHSVRNASLPYIYIYISMKYNLCVSSVKNEGV